MAALVAANRVIDFISLPCAQTGIARPQMNRPMIQSLDKNFSILRAAANLELTNNTVPCREWQPVALGISRAFGRTQTAAIGSTLPRPDFREFLTQMGGQLWVDPKSRSDGYAQVPAAERSRAALRLDAGILLGV